MSGLASIEWFRAVVGAYAAECDVNWLTGHIDEIEREVEQNYVELPKGADGEVICPGDTVYNERWTNGRVVYEVGFMDNDGTRVYDEEGDWALAGACCHNRKPTLEEVLAELAEFACEHGAGEADLPVFAELVREAVRNEA